MRTLLLFALLGFASAPSQALESEDPVAICAIDLAPRACGKTCRKGKACGDSWIARDKKCHRPQGSLCDE
jgi:hypothetical protein